MVARRVFEGICRPIDVICSIVVECNGGIQRQLRRTITGKESTRKRDSFNCGTVALFFDDESASASARRLVKGDDKVLSYRNAGGVICWRECRCCGRGNIAGREVPCRSRCNGRDMIASGILEGIRRPVDVIGC
ncbi:MAG: hypothetical protein Greene101449_411 [Candidatus Peregrinibacteria bacterium Greene1014_49]|nr:MAG: hypothetical protein Greene101449_411 [Candidatus Peregrinibacteria bacterium Greene1014_49]